MLGKFIFLGALSVAINLTAGPQVAYINAQIYTGEKIEKKNDAFVVKDGRFLKIGVSSEVINTLPPSDEVVDLKKARVLPGFIEGHGHLIGLGKSRQMLDLRGKTPEQIAALVQEAAKTQRAGTWIMGRGWDQNLWDNKQFPTKAIFSALNDSHPVYLRRVDGHGVLVNDAALKLSGVTKETVDPLGGKIMRDKNNEPTGVFIDNAIELVSTHLNKPSGVELAQALDVALAELASLGVTSFHDAGASRDHIELFKDYKNKNKLTLRIYAMLDGDDENLVTEYLAKGPQKLGDFLTVRSIKYFADGALGSRGAMLLSDYHDSPGHKGLLLIDEEKLTQKTKLAILHGFQVATHAIGDGANRMVLNAYERALPQGPNNARLRIEHAQLVDPSDHERFRKLSVIASMQPIHCTSDMAWVPDRLGPERIKERAYPWRSLLNHGAKVIFGSDVPVESASPIFGLYAAVTRQTSEGQPADGFMPEQKLSLREAMQAYFSTAAYGEFNEDNKGRIAEGYLADFVVFADDILQMPKSVFLKAKPILTVVGGQVVFGKLPL